MNILDFDGTSLRDWMAGVGLLRIVSATTDERMGWQLIGGRYKLVITDAPDDLAQRCADWVRGNQGAWHFGGFDNVTFGAATWRKHAQRSSGIETALWCAIASDGVMHRDGSKVQASRLEFGHGGGHQHWLASLRRFVENEHTTDDFARILDGRRADGDPSYKRRYAKIARLPVCRWDPAVSERQHAYMGSNPAGDDTIQDQTINALAAMGLASVPSSPTATGLSTPLTSGRTGLRWPLWTEPLCHADLEAALCCGWSWPTIEARRTIVGQLYCFSRGTITRGRGP